MGGDLLGKRDASIKCGPRNHFLELLEESPAYNLMMVQIDYLIPDAFMSYISDLESVFKSLWKKENLDMGFTEEAKPLKVFINLAISFLKLAKNPRKNCY